MQEYLQKLLIILSVCRRIPCYGVDQHYYHLRDVIEWAKLRPFQGSYPY